MLKKKKPNLKRARQKMHVASSRRRISRNWAVLKLHRRGRNFQMLSMEASTTLESTAAFCAEV